MLILDFKRHVLSSIFSIIAAPLLILSIVFAARSIDFLRGSQSIEGSISNVLARGTTINKKVLVEAAFTELRGEFYPVIRYSIGDSTYTFRQKVSEPYFPTLGESRPILVSKADPSIAKTRHFSQFWLAPLILGMFAAIFGAGAYLVHGFETSDIEERTFLMERAPRIKSSQISIQDNILDSAPEGKRTRYIVAEFSVNGNLFTARSEPRKGDVIVPKSVTIAYDPNDPSTSLILNEEN